MRKIVLLVALAACISVAFSPVAFSQTSNIVATISDTDSTAWASLSGYNATYSITLVSATGSPVPPGQAYRADTGATVTNPPAGNLDATGTFSVTIVSNSNIRPSGTQWQFKFCPAVSSGICNTVTLAINASGTYSTQLSAGAVGPRISGGIGNYAYNDTEVAAIANNSYLNITTPAIRCYSTSWGSCGGTSGAGFPITLGSTSIAASSTTTSIAGLTTLQNVQYLSCASELGAQINSAVTALGAAGGRIQLPNCTTATITTSATAIPAQISILGYGKDSTKINCTVAGDCIQFTMNPTSTGEIASEVGNFFIQGNGASSQVLMHFQGMSGYTLHDLQFEPYGGGSGSKVCLELDNAATGEFTEGNTSYNVNFERSCAPGVLFNQNAADSSTSFGYNQFIFKGASTGANYVLQFNGAGFLYNGSIQLFCNHVANGSGGGCIQFNNNFATDQSLGLPNQRLYVTAEENGSGSGTVIACTAANVLRFFGNVVNGAFNGSGSSLTNTYSGCSSSVTQVSIATDINTDINGNYYIPSGGGGLQINGILTSPGLVGLNIVTGSVSNGGWQIDGTAQTSGVKWQGVVSGKTFDLYDTTDNTVAFTVVSTPTTFANLVKTGSNSQFCWDSTAQYANTSNVCDTGISRTAANTIAFGNGTQGNSTALLKAAAFISAGTTFSVSGCGTATALVGGGTAGKFVGGSSTCSPVITTGITAPNGYACYIQDQTTSTAVFRQTAFTTTTATFTGSGTIGATDTLVFGCNPF